MSNNAARSGGKNDLSYWVVAIALIITGVAAPIGFLMIVLKLLSGRRRPAVQGRHPYYVQKEGQEPVGARTSAAPSAPRAGREQELIAAIAAKGKKLTVVGGIVAAVFAFVILTSLGDAVYWLMNGEPGWFVSDLMDMIPLMCFAGGGLGCLWAGVRRRKQASRYRSYLAMVGQHKSVPVSHLAKAIGRSPAKVREDLEDMLDEGLFPQGFLDYGGDALVLSGDGLSSQPEPQQPPKEQPDAHQQENAILAEIRAVNDAVDNEKLSAQIDRIGVITAKILEYQRNRPEKAPQLHSFLSYYLPTTLKILRAYSQLEDQEVAGENITSAMSRIEGMMDKVVEGFEKQLDQLFQGDAMDITTDVEVLERMLAKDGLSQSQGMTLGL